MGLDSYLTTFVSTSQALPYSYISRLLKLYLTAIYLDFSSFCSDLSARLATSSLNGPSIYQSTRKTLSASHILGSEYLQKVRSSFLGLLEVSEN
jgi:hypothetical protein